MSRPLVLCAFVLSVLVVGSLTASAGNTVDRRTHRVSGVVRASDGTPLPGVTVSLFLPDGSHSLSVSSQSDGSFVLDSPSTDLSTLRARLIGYEDLTVEDLFDDDSETASNRRKTLDIAMKRASGWDLEAQRTGDHLLDMLEWDSERDALNFRMMCTYCHQVGTIGFRSPEEPVDWEVMLTRMDGFAGLYEHTQEVLVDKIYRTYGREAEEEWAPFVAPPPPSGADLEATVAEWTLGLESEAKIHDLEVGADGVIYTVDMSSDAILTLDPATGDREVYTIPGGKPFGSDIERTKGPHSIEMDTDGNMWLTLALSGEMAFFDTKNKTYRVFPGHEAPRPRGGYPHTLRFAQNGDLWWTDAALGVFSLDPASWNADTGRYDVTFYELPDKDQVRGGGSRGESRGVTPYGIDVAPNGHVWYSKLNGQRVGRVAPELPHDHPEKVVEWKPPVHGPRRLHVAPDGLVWVPGFASGDIASFEPGTEEWAVYPLPKGTAALPYALNIHPETGDIWICGTGTDSMLRFDPKTKTFAEYRMPTRVTYTREIEFDSEGNVWTTNSNIPVRHVENQMGSVIRISVPSPD